MKTSITITGQISGNHRLLSACQTFESESFERMFNAKEIVFPTKKAAKKALWEAFKSLRAAEPEFAKGGITYSRSGTLRYDASKAEIC